MPRPRRKRRDAGRPRGAPIVDAVLARTLEELAATGPEGLSVQRIAQRAQVNKTSVYRRWPTREKLVAAALDSIRLKVAAQVPDTGSLKGDLRGLLRPVAALLGTPQGRALARAAAHASHRIDATGRPILAVIARARARGEWRAGLDARQVVFMLIGALFHRALIEQQPMGDPWVRRLVDLAVEGVRPRR